MHLSDPLSKADYVLIKFGTRRASTQYSTSRWLVTPITRLKTMGNRAGGQVFNAAQRWPNDVPLLLAAGDGSPFAKIIPRIAEGLRANGESSVKTDLLRDSGHYIVEEHPEMVADLIERYASLHSK